MRKILACLCLVLTLTAQAQEPKGRINGKVTDANTKTLASATIQLILAQDSSLVKMGIADKEGQFGFDQLPAGDFRVMITAIGHQKSYSEIVKITEAGETVNLGEITLVPAAKEMAAVSVTSRRPLIEQKAGKMVVNVEASPSNTGLNALELLEKSPGVSVDNNGNISLKGKQGVTVLVDGKPTYLSGEDLAALLKSMPSSQLDQIEVMTNPPAKYDAAGNSGIINIKTKKGIVRGMNGNANLVYSQGKYDRYNGGVNLNYRNNKLNVFGGYNGGTYEGFNNLTIDRKMIENGVLVRTMDQRSRPHWKGQFHNFKLGTDYYFSKKDVAGIVVNYGFNKNEDDPRSSTNIRNVQGDLLARLYAYNANRRNSYNLTTNFNYKHTFDSTGREITADFDYLRYDMTGNNRMTTESRDQHDNKLGEDVVLRGHIPSLINIYSGKVDYVHPFKSGWKMEAGLKASFVETNNQVEYTRNSGGGWVPDSRSNHFIYKENINAVYANFNRSIRKWEVSLGARVENTIARGHQLIGDSSFKRNYTNLFPNVGLSFNASEKHQWNFSYSRRLRRPDYGDLNPFIFFLDSLTYNQGNPWLQPQFTHNFELSHTFNRIFTTTINYTETNDVITELLKQNTEENKTFQTRENMSTMRQFGIALMANFPVGKWLNSNIYVNGYHNMYKGLYNNEPVNLKYNSVQINMTNTFTLGKGWGAELGGWATTKFLEGLLVARPMGALNVGFSKQVMQKKGNIKFGVRDLFYTQVFRGYALYSDVDVSLRSASDSRRFNISFTYRFGKSNIKPERRRSSSADDEASRVKS